jgi:LytS/YehU family sensor histidine kinase
MDTSQLNGVRKALRGQSREEHVGGLPNVAHRLSLLFPDQHRLAIDSDPNRGTTVMVRFPALAGSEVAGVAAALSGSAKG